MPASVPKLTVSCSWCGFFMQKTPYYLKTQKHHFCDINCKKQWQASPLNDYRDKISKTVSAIYFDEDKPSAFKAISDKRKSEGNIQKVCVMCSTVFNLWKSQADQGWGACCSAACKNERIITEGLNAGPNNGRWENGKTELGKVIRASDTNKAWIQAVLARDGYTCKISGQKTNLEVHHIIPLSKLISCLGLTIDNWKSYSHILFSMSNGITLTAEEHNFSRSKELTLANYYRSLL